MEPRDKVIAQALASIVAQKRAELEQDPKNAQVQRRLEAALSLQLRHLASVGPPLVHEGKVYARVEGSA